MSMLILAARIFICVSFKVFFQIRQFFIDIDTYILLGENLSILVFGQFYAFLRSRSLVYIYKAFSDCEVEYTRGQNQNAV